MCSGFTVGKVQERCKGGRGRETHCRHMTTAHHHSKYLIRQRMRGRDRERERERGMGERGRGQSYERIETYWSKVQGKNHGENRV